jgi:solute carrier family 9B (sodium/hydrogen exchanger), member 1/2
MLCALAAAKLCKMLRLPPLVGMIGVGIILGRYAGELWIDKIPMLNAYRSELQISPTLLGLSSDLRGLALVIILIRAGLGIQKNDLKVVGAPAIKMSILPASVEALFICCGSVVLLNFSLLEGGLLGFVLAAVSPAVIVPKMLQLIDRGIGMAKKFLPWFWPGHP